MQRERSSDPDRVRVSSNSNLEQGTENGRFDEVRATRLDNGHAEHGIIVPARNAHGPDSERAERFDVELGAFGGTQVLAEGSLEYLVLPYLTLGAGIDVGQLDVDIDGDEWNGAVETNIVGLRLFTKLRS